MVRLKEHTFFTSNRFLPSPAVSGAPDLLDLGGGASVISTSAMVTAALDSRSA